MRAREKKQTKREQKPIASIEFDVSGAGVYMYVCPACVCLCCMFMFVWVLYKVVKFVTAQAARTRLVYRVFVFFFFLFGCAVLSHV